MRFARHLHPTRILLSPPSLQCVAASVDGDPHLKLPEGGVADLRGEDGVFYVRAHLCHTMHGCTRANCTYCARVVCPRARARELRCVYRILRPVQSNNLARVWGVAPPAPSGVSEVVSVALESCAHTQDMYHESKFSDALFRIRRIT